MYNRVTMKNLVPIKSNKNNINSMIYEIRGKQVMLDFDLAFLYGYEVRRLNEQVKRNVERFPADFMFQLTLNEVNLVKSQIATSRKTSIFSGQDGGVRKLPYAFTEQGVYMLSTVLKGEVAVNQSIAIMRAFRDMRHLIKNNELILEKITSVEIKQIETNKQLRAIGQKFSNNDIQTQKIFYNGQIYDSMSFLVKLIKKAKNKLIIVDNYVDTQTLDLISKKGKNVNVTLYTSGKGNYLKETEIKKFSQQYGLLNIVTTDTFHDRFLIVDDKLAYTIGASIKDAGNKTFAINEIKDLNIIKEFLSRLKYE